VGNTKLMNARPEQLRVTQMNRSSKNSRDSCAAEEGSYNERRNRAPFADLTATVITI